MNVVDSSGWLEYLADGPNARFFEPPITKTGDLFVPTISLHEVFKRVLQQRGEEPALQARLEETRRRFVEWRSTQLPSVLPHRLPCNLVALNVFPRSPS